jgi:hypothetical protein
MSATRAAAAHGLPGSVHVAHWIPVRLVMISPTHVPVHFAVAATTGRPWCADTRDAGRCPWRESKDSVVLVCPSGEHGQGAKWEQAYALNGPERTSTALNGPALTCGSPISAGQRDIPNIVHTYELLQLTSTDLNYIKPQVNGLERPCREPQSRVSSSYFWEQTQKVP